MPGRGGSGLKGGPSQHSLSGDSLPDTETGTEETEKLSACTLIKGEMSLLVNFSVITLFFQKNMAVYLYSGNE